MSNQGKNRYGLNNKILRNQNTSYSNQIRKELKMPNNINYFTDHTQSLEYSSLKVITDMKTTFDSIKSKPKLSKNEINLIKPHEIPFNNVIPALKNLLNKYNIKNTSPERDLLNNLDIKPNSKQETLNTINIKPIYKENAIFNLKLFLEELTKKGVEISKLTAFIDELIKIREDYSLENNSLKLKIKEQEELMNELNILKKEYIEIINSNEEQIKNLLIENESLKKNNLENKVCLKEEKERLEKEIEDVKNIYDTTLFSQERLETDLHNLKSENQVLIKENNNIKIINFNLKKEISNIKNELKMKRFDKLFITRIKQMFFPSVNKEETKNLCCDKENNQDKFNTLKEEISKKEKVHLEEKEKLNKLIFSLKQIEIEHQKEKILLESSLNDKINALKLENVRLHQINDSLLSINNKESFIHNNIIVFEINLFLKQVNKDLLYSWKLNNDNNFIQYNFDNATKTKVSKEVKLRDLFNHISILKSDYNYQESNQLVKFLRYLQIDYQIHNNINFQILNEAMNIDKTSERVITSFHIFINTIPKNFTISQENFEINPHSKEFILVENQPQKDYSLHLLDKETLKNEEKLQMNKIPYSVEYTNRISLYGKNEYLIYLIEDKVIDLHFYNDNLGESKYEIDRKHELESLRNQIRKYEEKIYNYMEETSKLLDDKKSYSEIIDSKNSILIQEKECHISHLNSFIQKNLKLEFLIENIKRNQKALQKKFKLKENENNKLINELNELKKEKNYSFNLDLLNKLSDNNIPLNPKVDQIDTFHCSEDDFKKSANHSRCCNNEELVKEKEELQQILKTLFVEHLYTLFVLENSFNLCSLNEIICNNFSRFSTNLFEYTTNNNHYQPFSIIKEYLEDVFILINEEFKSHNSKLLIDENYIDSKMIKSVADTISKSNLFFLLFIKFNHQSQDLIINNVKEKLEDLFSQTYHDHSIKSLLKDPSISNDLSKKIEIFNKNTIDSISKVVEQCKNMIFRGSIYVKHKEIYKLSNSNLNILFDEKDMYVGESICSIEKLNSLIHRMKYENKKIKSIILTETFKKKEIDLFRIISTITNYCSNLTLLTINDNIFSETQFSSINKVLDLPSLKTLNLNRNQLNDYNIKILAESIDNNDSLICLHLSDNIIGSKGLYYLAKSLQKNKRLEQLFMNSNQISSHGVLELVNTLTEKNRTLKYLNVANNPLNNKDVLLFCKLIKKNKILVFLNLSQISFSYETIGELSKSLQFNNSLKELFLENIKFNSNLLYNFVTSYQNCHLNQLSLSHNTINDNSSLLISKLIMENKELRVLTLRNCNLSAQSIVIIFKGLQSGSLEKIDLRENPKGFDETSLTCLVKIQKNTIIILSKDDLGEKEGIWKNSININIY